MQPFVLNAKRNSASDMDTNKYAVLRVFCTIDEELLYFARCKHIQCSCAY